MIGFRGKRGGEAPAPVETSVGLISRRFAPTVAAALGAERIASTPRADLAALVKRTCTDLLAQERLALNLLDQRQLVTEVLNALVAQHPYEEQPAEPAPRDVEVPSWLIEASVRDTDTLHVPAPPPVAHAPAAPSPTAAAPVRAALRPDPPPAPSAMPRASVGSPALDDAIAKLQPTVMGKIDTSAAAAMTRDELARELGDILVESMAELKIQLNSAERREVLERMLDDMLGLGPLEPLLADEAVADIMVNGAKQIYIERKGKLTLTDLTFRDDAHVMSIATRIVTAIGRRVDESTPLVDARLQDGSRVNIIIPPLAIDGPSISIRKFSKKKITLEVMERQNNLSPQMATVLRIAARARCNILISGGTGSGKTTLLNALSQMIDVSERVVTIEDAAELQLLQPHVVRLETRPANLEGEGEITMRDLVKNSLRMRPDRIILGEIRSAEAIDMLQAMNTGHDGSLATIHANRPREALSRLENLIGMAGINLPIKAARQQIAAAIDLIVQVARMRDGVRRITAISEVVGMEGEVITMQDLFWYEHQGEDQNGKLLGVYKSAAVRPAFIERAQYCGLDRPLLEAMG
jgi:pilus assembly protein CpaF